MPQSLSKVLIHIVFSTKERRAFLQGAEIRVDMHKYLAGISSNLKCPAVMIGGMPDHVHILARQHSTISLANWVKELKRGSSLWIKTQGPEYRLFQWQAGYGAFSVSQSQCERVNTYIVNQERHHRRKTFQDEFRQLMNSHEIPFDERYVWD